MRLELSPEVSGEFDVVVCLVRVLATFAIRCCHIILGLISDGEYSLDVHYYVQFSRQDAGGLFATKAEGRSFHSGE